MKTGNLRNCNALSSGHAHVTADAWPVVAAIDDEIVALGLEADGAVDGGVEQVVIARCSQRFAQIRGVLVTEAGVDRTSAGNPHAIA